MYSAKKSRLNRRGATAVEFALTVPVLLLFVFSSMEFARANILRNTCENAAMQGARTGMLPGATAQKCIDAAQDVLDLVGVTNPTITVDPTTITSSTQFVTVTVKVPLSENALPMSEFILGGEMEQTISLPRELD